MFFRLTGNNKEAEAHLQEARRIYGALAEQHPDTAEHQVGLAASFNNLGLLYRSTGNFAQAEFHHKEGLKIDRDMTGRYPDVVLYQRRLGQTYHNMGLMYTEFDKIAQAEDCYREALTVKERLAVQHSDDEYQHDLILSHLNLALVYLDHGKDKEAVPLFEKALALLQGLSERHPEISAYQNQMSRAQRGLADCYDNLGRAPDAERHYKEALAIIQRLADRYPEVGEHRSDLARCHNNFAGFYYAAGEHLRAEPHYRKALALREVLARDNPEITWNQRDLAESHSNMGLLLHALALPRRDARQFQESEDHFRKALVIQESLSQRQPGHLDMATDLAATHEKLGNLQLNRGQLDEAVTLYAKAIHLLEDILAKESGRADARGHLGIARGKRAAALVKLNRYGEALPDLERALALADGPAREDLRVRIADCLVRTGAHARAVTEVEALANPKSPAPTLYNLACVYALSAAAAAKDAKLANGERARLAEKYSARAVVLLGDARKAGFFKEARSIDHMKKDTDLDPLRGREDYRKLLAELERK